MYTQFLFGENLVKISFTEKVVIGMQAEYATFYEHAHKLGLIGDTVASHRIKPLQNLRLLDKHTAWRRASGFNRRDVWMEIQR